MSLIIVESPTKARTFNRILKGKDFFVFATMGHIRDLPAKSISIDYTHEFAPDYQIINGKQKVVDQMKKLAKEHKEIIFATDADREGESISYHAAAILGLIKEAWPQIEMKKKTGEIKRIVFHEITPKALQEALDNPSTLRIDLVKAQQARRILDRIVGYELSPLLWKKMGKNWLSAGRVQTVALRLIVEREKEIKAFKEEPYFQIYGMFALKPEELKAKLIKKDDEVIEKMTKLELFAGDYTFTKTIISAENINSYIEDLKTDSYTISEVNEEVIKRYPPPPYTTSLLQQDGFNRWGFTSKMTMKLAQDLYERGLITYHRTDSFNLSANFVFPAKDYITKTYGAEYALEKPRGFRSKSKMAQEAHEAIRPTKLDRDVKTLEKEKNLTVNHKKLYSMIFNRALATQMKEADVKSTKVYIKSTKDYLFESEHQKVVFDGFLKVLNPDFAAKHASDITVKQGSPMKLESLEPQESKTKPPPRYNEASLIKIMEEKGIGRPSTYAPIISLVQGKNYIEKEGRYFRPTNLGEAISDYLSASFPQLFDLNFTAELEQSLDEIAGGEKELVKTLTDFYDPLKKELTKEKKDTSVINVQEEISEKCPKCGSPLTVRFSKFGKFYACSGYPNCKFTKPYLYFVSNRFCPKDGGRIVTRFTKFKKKFYGCENYPKCDYSAWALKGVPQKKDDKPAPITVQVS